ncbi:MAG: KH domain-containing protein [Nanobdellota archaeon]
MEEYSYQLKIPKDRIAVIIGKEGAVKDELEEQSKSNIFVDSQEGDIRIQGTDSVLLFQLKDVIKAIGRGFNPEIAVRLFKPDYILEILTMNDYAKEKNHFVRLKGRIIGKNGKSRETIEHLTDTNISVYGKTIAIVGFCDNVEVSKRAVDSLLKGSPHSSVFKMLERQHKQWRIERQMEL